GSLVAVVARIEKVESLSIQAARSLGLERQQLGHGGRVPAVEQLGRRYAETAQVLERQVDATAPGIFADVPDDVGHLEGEPEPLGVLVGRTGRMAAEDPCRQQADDSGGPVA